jgi:hypothetical protein
MAVSKTIKMKNRIKVIVGVTLCASVLLLQGCTKEKAEAIKVAAKNFRTEASTAFNQIREILKQNVAMPPKDNEALVKDLNQTNFNYGMLQMLLSEDQIGSSETVQIDKKIDDIEKYYDAFAQMFGSLPQGSFFAANSVEQAERHAVNLTVQMINMAKLIQQGKIPVHLNAKRILLVEQITRDNAVADEKLKQDLLKTDAQQITALATEEAQIRNQAIAQCLKAAEMGRLVAKLIRNYKTLSVGDILALTQQSLGFAAEISNQNADVVSLLKRYNAVEETIQADPYWNKLLDDKLQINPTH